MFKLSKSWEKFLFGDEEYMGIIYDVLSVSFKFLIISVIVYSMFVTFVRDMPGLCGIMGYV